MKNLFHLLILLALTASCAKQADFASYVNPFVGTDRNGHTFPGATTPFGMVQLSPDTRIDGSWSGCSGYHYSDSIIYGFSHTHLSGTGVSDYGDILVMPQTGEASFEQTEYAASFSRENESASPGTYSVLLDNDIQVDLTTTPRVGLHRYRFPMGAASIIIDLEHRDHLLESQMIFESQNSLFVGRRSRAWAQDQNTYSYIQTQLPFTPEVNADSSKVILHFDEGTEEVLLKAGISFTGIDGAVKNSLAELQDYDFERVKEEARERWNEELGKIEIQDENEEKLRTFYTALYHTMIHPNAAMDVDGTYRGMDGQMHEAKDFTYYTVFSLWDTFRATHPLCTIIDRKRTRDFIRTFLAMYQQGGRLPVWELCSNETDCMIGYHSVSVITDALTKGIDDFDQELAVEAMVKSATWDHLGLPAYQAQGFIAVDDEHESVSKTLEYAYDDWCIARAAKHIGRDSLAEVFLHRSNAWRNLLDPETTFMRPRKNGGWLTPFDPRQVNNHFTEGNSWQYSFFVPHDIEGMIEAMGGATAFEQKLDSLFEAPTETTGRTQADITGLIGQYAHGNETSHHMAYLYNYVDRPEKTTHRVHQILSDFYSSQPDGLIGNEDCGQMSAWYVMSALGIYAIAPGKAEYNLTEPFFQDYTVHLENGKTFGRETIARALKAGMRISHEDLTGEPTAQIKEETLDFEYVRPPVIEAPSISFDDSLAVRLKASSGDSVVYMIITEDGQQTNVGLDPKITLRSNATIQAYAFRDRNGVRTTSTTVHACFYKHPHPDWDVQITGQYNPQYSAGGDKGLIDGIRGDKNWRKGYWQGYQGQDFEVIIKLDQTTSISTFRSSYLQDTRSWIIFPTEVEYLTSQDESHFQSAGKVKNEAHADDYEVQVRSFNLDLKSAVNARYVKVVAKNYGTLPEWHQGHGDEAFIFVDEVEIEQ